MQVFTVLFSLLVLTLYGVLTHHSTDFALLSPRGGGVILGFSLLLANLAARAACQPERPMNQRFQLILAAWIWLAVQLFGVVYSLRVTVE